MKNKKKTNKIPVYILYEYEEFQNDYRSIKEYLSIKDLQADASKEYGLTHPVSIYHYITASLENIPHLLKDKYIIIKEYADARDLYDI